MDWITGIQNAINYMEDHLTEEIDYDEVARKSFSSSFHFQRVFSILCGMTLGEYIRSRRLSQAGIELASTNARVIDVAAKYGYESPESFAKAFQKFHGMPPSRARTDGAMLKSFSRLSIKISLEGGTTMNYRIEEKPGMVLTGYKKRFAGDPNDKKDQDNCFACETRLFQYVLQGAAREHTDTWNVLTNFGPDGYDFYIAYQLPGWELREFDENIGEFAKNFEHLSIPAGTYLICETECRRYPVGLVEDLRRKAVTEWMPSSGYALRDAPELDLIHWFWEEGNDAVNNSRYCEVWLPIMKKK